MAFPMSLGRFATLVGASPRWVQNALQALELPRVYDERSAAEFSFFLAMPTMAGAFAYDFYKNRDIIDAAQLELVAVGFVCAFVAAVLVVRSLLDFVSRHGFSLFGWWRIVVGGIGIAAIVLSGG